MNPTFKKRLIRSALWVGLTLAVAFLYLMMAIAGVSMILLGWIESIRDSLRERLGLEPLF